MSTSSFFPPPGAPLRRHGGARRVAVAVASAAGLGLVALLVVRFVLPSRLEAATGGLAGVIANLASRHPLATGLVVFVILAEVWRYWSRRRWDAGEAVAPPAVGRRPSRRLIAALVLAALATFVLRTSIVETFSVSGPSMLPTLLPNDTLLVDRMAYGFRFPLSNARLRPKAPARGDLVVFRATVSGSDRPQMVVKRVIGLPGDRVAFVAGDVILNGWSIFACDAGPFVGLVGKLHVGGRLTVESLGDKTYLAVRKPLDADSPEYLVKPGEVFVLGDNRGLSSDSRLWTAATGRGVPIAALEGRVTRIAVGAAADGGMNLSRLFAKPNDLKVLLPGVDMTKTRERIAACLSHRSAPPTRPNPAAKR